MCVVVGGLYFMGLYIIWHIPSFFSEVAIKVYLSTEDAVTNYLLHEKINHLLLSDQKVKQILDEENLKI